MDENAYRNHCEKSKRAKILCKIIQDLYGVEASTQTLFFRAKLDGVITEEEHRLLKKYT